MNAQVLIGVVLLLVDAALKVLDLAEKVEWLKAKAADSGGFAALLLNALKSTWFYVGVAAFGVLVLATGVLRAAVGEQPKAVSPTSALVSTPSTAPAAGGNFTQNIYGNSGVVVGQAQQVTIQNASQQQTALSLTQSSVRKLEDGTYENSAVVVSSNQTMVLPRVTFFAHSPSLVSLKVIPNGGIGMGVYEGDTLLNGKPDGGKFASFANLICPCHVTAIMRNSETVNLDWNTLDPGASQ